MKICISNLAWDHKEDGEVLKLLKEYNIKAIEVACSKIWPNPTDTTESEIIKYKKFWNKHDIDIVATTSLLFGHPEFQIFSDNKTRSKTFGYLSNMIRVASLLGAKALVFGSPKNRVTNGKSKEEIKKIATEFFTKIGEYSRKYDAYFGIEPNPPIYGTDFVNTTKEAIELVGIVNHPNFCVHLDTSTMTINRENYLDTINKSLPYAHHYHISEPGLKPIPTPETNHKKVAMALRKSAYKDWASIEMPLGGDANNIEQIEKTLKFITQIYQ